MVYKSSHGIKLPRTKYTHTQLLKSKQAQWIVQCPSPGTYCNVLSGWWIRGELTCRQGDSLIRDAIGMHLGNTVVTAEKGVCVCVCVCLTETDSVSHSAVSDSL